MPEVLSQEEVDALLRGVSGGDIEVESEGADRGAGVNSFDFANQDRIVRGRMPTLDMVHDRFCRNFRTTISTTLRRVVDVSIARTDMMKFGDFIRTLPLPTSLNLFRMDPLRGYGLLVFEGKLVFAFVDTFFGGCGLSHVKLEGRDFTVIEQRLIQKVVDRALEDYLSAWRAVEPLEISHVRSEVNPQFVNIVPPSDVVVTVRLDLEFEEAAGMMAFCLPYSTLEPIKDKLRAGFQSEAIDTDRMWITRLRQQLMEVNVDMSVVLGNTEITGRQLLDLKVDDVLILDEHSDEPVQVFVEDMLKCTGRVGVHKGQRAVQVEELIETKR